MKKKGVYSYFCEKCQVLTLLNNERKKEVIFLQNSIKQFKIHDFFFNE